MARNLVLGRGKVYLAPYVAGAAPKEWRYLGNSPEFNVTIESETLEHFSSDEGVNQKDEEIALSTNRTGTLTTDDISADNQALFFFGSTSTVTHSASTVTGEALNAVKQGFSYWLGVTAQNPGGVQGLEPHTPSTDNIIVTDDTDPTPVEFVEGTDYTINMDTGELHIIEGGSIDDDTNLLVSYKIKAGSFTRVISGSEAVEVALKYVTQNPVGPDSVWLMPHVKLSPNGDYALKGDEWQQLSFSLSILKDTGFEAITIDGRKVA